MSVVHRISSLTLMSRLYAPFTLTPNISALYIFHEFRSTCWYPALATSLVELSSVAAYWFQLFTILGCQYPELAKSSKPYFQKTFERWLPDMSATETEM